MAERDAHGRLAVAHPSVIQGIKTDADALLERLDASGLSEAAAIMSRTVDAIAAALAKAR